MSAWNQLNLKKLALSLVTLSTPLFVSVANAGTCYSSLSFPVDGTKALFTSSPAFTDVLTISWTDNTSVSVYMNFYDSNDQVVAQYTVANGVPMGFPLGNVAKMSTTWWHSLGTVTVTASGCGSSSSSGSSSNSGYSPASTTSATIIQSDVSRVTRSAVTANNSMMSQGLERFIGDRESGTSLTYAISTSGLDDVVWGI